MTLDEIEMICKTAIQCGHESEEFAVGDVLALLEIARAAEMMRFHRWLCVPAIPSLHRPFPDNEGCPGCAMNVALDALAKPKAVT